jgi:hypothetical protein
LCVFELCVCEAIAVVIDAIARLFGWREGIASAPANGRIAGLHAGAGTELVLDSAGSYGPRIVLQAVTGAILWDALLGTIGRFCAEKAVGALFLRAIDRTERTATHFNALSAIALEVHFTFATKFGYIGDADGHDVWIGVEHCLALKAGWAVLHTGLCALEAIKGLHTVL